MLCLARDGGGDQIRGATPGRDRRLVNYTRNDAKWWAILDLNQWPLAWQAMFVCKSV